MNPLYRLLAAGLLCAALSTVAAETAGTPPQPVDATVLLDPDADATARVEQLQRLKANALAGDHAATCLLGRLAYAGPRHAAKPPPFEYGDAATWLSQCVLGGDLDAMLVMAELELDDRRLLEAMVWMQSHLKLAAAIDPAIVNEASPYKAGILARIEKMYGGVRPANEEVLEYTAGFIASHGERILEGYRSGGRHSDLPVPMQAPIEMLGPANSLAGRFTRDTSSVEDELVYAKFLVEVGADGRPGRVLVVESYPDAKAARALSSHARSRRFNAVDAAAERWVYLPVIIDNKAYDLMPGAGAKYRPKRH